MNVRTIALAGAIAAAVAGSFAAPATAQDALTSAPLEVGAVAPDFAITAATRYGVLRDQVRLSDYAGQTVVLAFFFRARTRG